MPVAAYPQKLLAELEEILKEKFNLNICFETTSGLTKTVRVEGWRGAP